MRKPDPNENNANDLLIQKGAISVDFNGNPLIEYKPSLAEANQLSINEPTVNYENKILELLKPGEYAVKDIIKKLQLSWSEKKLTDYLKSKKDIETINKKTLQFTIKDSTLNRNHYLTNVTENLKKISERITEKKRNVSQSKKNY